MPVYLKKDKGEILRLALRKLQTNTSITSVGPGSIARAMTEAITTELGDMYDLLDFNLGQQLVSTATGSALDLLGELYAVERKTVSNLIQIDKEIGAFYFYVTTPVGQDIVIPRGTNIYTDTTTFIGQRFSYSTTEDNILPTGRTRVFAAIKPNFTDSVFTAGTNTLVIHDFQSPPGITLLCKNPKVITPQLGYEDDDSYRFRVIKAIRVAASGTAEAVRLQALSMAGVRDVNVRQAPYGLGSFELIVVPEDFNQVNAILERVSVLVDPVRPVGVRAFIRKPEIQQVDVSLELVIPSSDADEIGSAAVQRATVAVMRYISQLLPGDLLVYNRLIQAVLDSSEIVRDVIVNTFRITGSEVARRNYQPASDVLLIPGSINVEIARA